MEINKKELRKVSRRFRTLGSRVMNADFKEQNQALSELMNFVDETPILFNYINSLSYEIDNLQESVKEVNNSYGRKTIDLGDDTEKRIFLLYKIFKCIIELNLDTENFGAFYSGYKNYQKMAKAFRERLVYPFISGVELYIFDISTDMGLDDNNSYNITINSSGVQVNIAQDNSLIKADQKNDWQSKELNKAFIDTEEAINNMDDGEDKKILRGQLEVIKNEVKKAHPQKTILQTSLNTMKYIIKSIAFVPKLKEGIESIANLLDLAF